MGHVSRLLFIFIVSWPFSRLPFMQRELSVRYADTYFGSLYFPSVLCLLRAVSRLPL